MLDVDRVLATYKQDQSGIEVENFMEERSPRGQLLIAAEYIIAAVILEPNNDNGPLLRPKYMLACQAIELSLKAALQLSGTSPQDLKRSPLNHDLAALLQRCMAMPEFKLEAEHVNIINAVAPAMSAFTFRYGLEAAGSASQPTRLQLPPLILVIKAANVVRETAWRLLQIWPDEFSPNQSKP